jgi:hypothetical protein
MTGLRLRKKSTLEVFRQWDRVIFPNSDSSLVRQDQDTSSSGLKKMMAGLEEDSDGEEED